jgi:hypothetical protein
VEIGGKGGFLGVILMVPVRSLSALYNAMLLTYRGFNNKSPFFCKKFFQIKI